MFPTKHRLMIRTASSKNAVAAGTKVRARLSSFDCLIEMPVRK